MKGKRNSAAAYVHTGGGKYKTIDEVLSNYNPRVSMNLRLPSLYGRKEFTIKFELFKEPAPKTVENFKSLLTEECGIGPYGRPMRYRDSAFHKIIPGYFLQGGDIVKSDGTSGWSIYGPSFPDENLEYAFDRPGLLAMANNGPNTNNSQFFITMCPLPWLNGKHVIFGRLVSGYSLLQYLQLAAKPNKGDYTPHHRLVIEKCRVIKSRSARDPKFRRRDEQKLNENINNESNDNNINENEK